MPGNHPKENKQHSEHGESLKLRILKPVYFCATYFSYCNMCIFCICVQNVFRKPQFPRKMLAACGLKCVWSFRYYRFTGFMLVLWYCNISSFVCSVL